jgi:cyclopropane-fatty-acyl-phospholipid synthase
MPLLDQAADAMKRLFPEAPWKVRLTYQGQSRSFGNGEERTWIEFHDPRPLRRLAWYDIAGFLDHYVAGRVDLCGDIYGFVGLRMHVQKHEDWTVDLFRKIRYLGTTLFPSSVRRKLIAVSSHYDLSNEFILSYLDKRTKAYSCAMWKDAENIALPEDEPLEDAQHRKFHQAASALELQPDDKFLDIGCGYGYMVNLAETEFGVKDALGITLSKNQVDEGFSRNMRLAHYYELPRDGRYDKIYTCGMVSHLDRSEIVQYYEHVYGLLKSGGMLWMHGIVPPALSASVTNYTTISGTFSQRYVFPDHYQFPVHEHIKVMETIGFRIREVRFKYGHYAKTLRHWYRRYLENLPETRRLINPTIERAWHLFLTYGSVVDGPWSIIKQIRATKD